MCCSLCYPELVPCCKEQNQHRELQAVRCHQRQTNGRIVVTAHIFHGPRQQMAKKHRTVFRADEQPLIPFGIQRNKLPCTPQDKKGVLLEYCTGGGGAAQQSSRSTGSELNPSGLFKLSNQFTPHTAWKCHQSRCVGVLLNEIKLWTLLDILI